MTREARRASGRSVDFPVPSPARRRRRARATDPAQRSPAAHSAVTHEQTGGRETIARLVADKRVLVCCGAGGVGKTTTSASIALAAARAGQRVVVIHDRPQPPAGRDDGHLGQRVGARGALGVAPALAGGRAARVAVGVDSQPAARLRSRRAHRVDGGEDVRALLQNRVYQNVSSLIAGMQEYAAVEALHGFIVDDRYDLVVLDTPPSGNALRFLEAPSRANAFLDRACSGCSCRPTAAPCRARRRVILKGMHDRVLGAGRSRRAPAVPEPFSRGSRAR